MYNNYSLLNNYLKVIKIVYFLTRFLQYENFFKKNPSFSNNKHKK